jgi:hypothetical protein
MTKMCPNGYFVTTCSLLLSLATAAWSVDSSAAETWVSEPTARLQHPYIYFRAAAAWRGEARSCASAAHGCGTQRRRTVRWWMLGRMGSSKACFIQYERSNVDPKSLSLLHCCCCCYCYHHPPPPPPPPPLPPPPLPPPPPRYCYQHPRTTIVDAPKRFWVRHALLTHCYCIPRLLPLITLYLPLWS